MVSAGSVLMPDDLLTTETRARAVLFDALVARRPSDPEQQERILDAMVERLRGEGGTPETLPEISPDDWRWQLWRHTQPGVPLRQQCGACELCCLSEPEYQAGLARLLAATQPVDAVTAAAEEAAQHLASEFPPERQRDGSWYQPLASGYRYGAVQEYTQPIRAAFLHAFDAAVDRLLAAAGEGAGE